jgi:hypothetical protein
MNIMIIVIVAVSDIGTNLNNWLVSAVIYHY